MLYREGTLLRDHTRRPVDDHLLYTRICSGSKPNASMILKRLKTFFDDLDEIVLSNGQRPKLLSKRIRVSFDSYFESRNEVTRDASEEGFR